MTQLQPLCLTFCLLLFLYLLWLTLTSVLAVIWVRNSNWIYGNKRVALIRHQLGISCRVQLHKLLTKSKETWLRAIISPLNNTNLKCVYIILIVYSRPFQRGAAWFWENVCRHYPHVCLCFSFQNCSMHIMQPLVGKVSSKRLKWCKHISDWYY